MPGGALARRHAARPAGRPYRRHTGTRGTSRSSGMRLSTSGKAMAMLSIWPVLATMVLTPEAIPAAINPPRANGARPAGRLGFGRRPSRLDASTVAGVPRYALYVL